MSLINDALRRANQEKKKQSPDASGGAPMHPVNPPQQFQNPFFGPILWILIAVVLLGAGWLFWKSSQTKSEQGATSKAQVPVPARKSTTRSTEVAKANSQSDTVPISAPVETKTDSSAAPVVDETPATQSNVEAAPNPGVTEPASVPVVETSDANAARTVETPPTLTPPMLKLQGVFYRLSNPTVLINGRTLSEGEKISGAQVVKIERQSVSLEWNGQTIILEMTQ